MLLFSKLRLPSSCKRAPSTLKCALVAKQAARQFATRFVRARIPLGAAATCDDKRRQLDQGEKSRQHASCSRKQFEIVTCFAARFAARLSSDRAERSSRQAAAAAAVAVAVAAVAAAVQRVALGFL